VAVPVSAPVEELRARPSGSDPEETVKFALGIPFELKVIAVAELVYREPIESGEIEVGDFSRTEPE
jgi:hypothetical protein